MKCNYKSKILVTVDDVKREVKRECAAKIDAVYEEVKQDVASQIMAVCCTELNKEFGFGKDRLKKFYLGVNCLFKLMSTNGIFGKEFTPINCIEVLKEKYEIDLEKKWL